ncbi:MBL fold metallo-hydrolase [Virgibacillus necropolis]|uniref:Pyrroloquinoline quinone biosynthesis protein PqqB n=1 Tax=Virgibacillus necropolis TaxID=163877 RepID=A0A221MF00_9BACI|nr:MBL fold metallo-hydrolase [Virgibacillus necropolis]ASN06170.1 pyrroloquinoline quinone biosynthesis protein PqqB [Virgibacillus necropolis]
MFVKVLGTAQDAGVPHPNCFCENCELARQNKSYQRFASSLSIHFPKEGKWYLIDPSPDFKEQLTMVQNQKKWRKVMDGIFLTHAHIGHYTGLAFLGKEAISTNRMPVMAGGKMSRFLSSHYPWKQLIDFNNIQLETLEDRKPYTLPEETSIIPLAVPHRNEFSETFGFIIRGNQKCLLYIPDIDRWDEWHVDLDELMKNMDYCLIDGTFYSAKELEQLGRSYNDIPHPLITDSMEKFRAYKSTCNIYFTHFNHTNPVIRKNGRYKELIEENGFFILEEGHEFSL